MPKSNPSYRILTELGEPETVFGLNASDLKILIPAVFIGLIIARNTPQTFSTIGWGVASLVILGSLLVIYITPNDQAVQSWILDRYRYFTSSKILTLKGRGVTSGGTRDFHPETSEDSVESSAQLNRNAAKTTQSLTELDQFVVGHDAGRRKDGYLFGAVEVDPANMALATFDDWEHNCRSFATFINGIEFPVQIYSTVSPVEPSTVTAGYRHRLRSGSLDDQPVFRDLVRAYERSFPLEFAHRGTSIRRFFVIVPVSKLEVQRSEASIGQTSVLNRLSELPYLGGFITSIGISRQGYTPEEIEARQVTELDRRLDSVEEGLRRIPGCDASRLQMPALVALIQDFWDPQHPDFETPPSLRTTPVVAAASSTSGEDLP